jgi:predicted Zn-dependent peptidase
VEQSIHSHVYPNGLVLVAEEMQSLESAAFTFRVPAGCIYEPDNRGGLAGLTCEMALRGAGSRDNRQFINDLDNLGVERGESVSDAHTSYSGATLAKTLLSTLAIYADLLRRPQLPGDQLEAGRLIALQELSAVEDEPAQKVMLELRRRHYPEPWGRPSQGSEQGLSESAIGDIRKFFARHYQPGGTILGIAGRFQWPRLRDEIGKLLGDWKNTPLSEPPEGDSQPQAAHLEHESNQTQIGVAYPSAAYRDADYFQAWGAVGVLSGGMSSRLFTEVREKRGLCYSVYASHHSLKGRGAVMCYAGTTAERAQETLDVMLGELRRLGDGVEREELDRLKARIKSALIMQQESSSSRSAALARDWYYLGRVRTLDEIARLVDELSCESINAYLAEHRPRDFTIVTLGPQALEVPVAVS